MLQRMADKAKWYDYVLGVTVLLLILWMPDNQAAIKTFDVSSIEEGAQLCTQIAPATPGQYYVRMTASNSQGYRSALSTNSTLIKTLPGLVCWQNPMQNVNESVLVDLVAVTVYYDTAEITNPPAIPKSPATAITVNTDCAAATCQSATVIQGVTSAELRVTWNTADGPYSAQVFEWPIAAGAVPVAQAAGITNNTFNWTPARAGLYSLNVNGQTLTSATTHLFYIKLAAPQGGTIE